MICCTLPSSSSSFLFFLFSAPSCSSLSSINHHYDNQTDVAANKAATSPLLAAAAPAKYSVEQGTTTGGRSISEVKREQHQLTKQHQYHLFPPHCRISSRKKKQLCFYCTPWWKWSLSVFFGSTMVKPKNPCDIFFLTFIFLI